MTKRKPSFMKRLSKKIFRTILSTSHYATSEPRRFRIWGKSFLRFMGWFVFLTKKGKKRTNVEDAAKEWQGMFLNRKDVPIVKVEEDTVFAEIRTRCPYRGSGNVAGCVRMMEYDRKVAETIGADFVVLRSQAEENVEVCLIAITKNKERSDLLEVDKRVAQNKERPDFSFSYPQRVEPKKEKAA